MLTSNKVTQSNKGYYQKLGYESYLYGREDAYGYFSGRGVQTLGLGDPKIAKDDPRLKLLLQGKDLQLNSLRQAHDKPRQTYYLQKKNKRRRIRLSKEEVAVLQDAYIEREEWSAKLQAKVAAFGEAHPQEHITKVLECGVLAFDQVFSAPKDLSILWALASHQEDKERFLQIHLGAVAKGLEVLQDNTYIRCGAGGKEHIKADATFAQFTHELSRDRDMQLHTHCLQFNFGMTEDGSRSGAVDARKLYDAWLAAGMAYQNEARFQLESLGFSTYDRAFSNQKGVTFGIKGISSQVRDAFSRRSVVTRKNVTESMSAPQIRNEFLKTRQAKETDIASPDILDEWNARANILGFDCDTLIAHSRARTETHYNKGTRGELINKASQQPLHKRVQGHSVATTSGGAAARSDTPKRLTKDEILRRQQHYRQKLVEKIETSRWEWAQIDSLVQAHTSLTSIEHRFQIPLSIQIAAEAAEAAEAAAANNTRQESSNNERRQEIQGALQQAIKATKRYLGQHTFEHLDTDKKAKLQRAKVVKPIFGEVQITEKDVIFTQACQGRNGFGTLVPLCKEALFRAQSAAQQVFVNTLQEIQERQGYSTQKFSYNKKLGYAPFLIHEHSRSLSSPKENVVLRHFRPAEERKKEILKTILAEELVSRNRGVPYARLEESALQATQGEMHPHNVLKQLKNPSFTKKYCREVHREYDSVVGRDAPLYQLKEEGLDAISTHYTFYVGAQKTLCNEKLKENSPHRYQQIVTAHHNAINTTIRYVQEYHTVAAQGGDLLSGFVKQVAQADDAFTTTLYHRPFGLNQKGYRQAARQSPANDLTVQLIYDNALSHELSKVGITRSKQFNQNNSSSSSSGSGSSSSSLYSTVLSFDDDNGDGRKNNTKDRRTQAEIDNRALVTLLERQEVYQQREGDRLLSSAQHLNAYLRADGGKNNPLDVVERVQNIHQRISNEVKFPYEHVSIDPITLEEKKYTYNRRYYQIKNSVAERTYQELSLSVPDELSLVYHATTDRKLRSIIDHALVCGNRVAVQELEKQTFSNQAHYVTGLQAHVLHTERSELSRDNLPTLSTTIKIRAVSKNEYGETGIIDKDQLWHEQRRLEQLRNNEIRYRLQQCGVKTYSQDTKKKGFGIEGVSSKVMRGINRRWGSIVEYRYSLGSVDAVIKQIRTYGHVTESSNCSPSYEEQQKLWRTLARRSGINVDAAASSGHFLHAITQRRNHTITRDTAVSINKRAATNLFCRERMQQQQQQHQQSENADNNATFTTSIHNHLFLRRADIESAFLTAASGTVSSDEALTMAAQFVDDCCDRVQTEKKTDVQDSSSLDRYTLNHNAYRHVDAKTRVEKLRGAYRALVSLHRSCKQIAYSLRQQQFQTKLTLLYATGRVSRKQYLKYRAGFTLPESKFRQVVAVSLGLISSRQVKALTNLATYQKRQNQKAQKEFLRSGGGYYQNRYQETLRQRSLKEKEWSQLVQQVQQEARKEAKQVPQEDTHAQRKASAASYRSYYEEWGMSL